MNAPPLLPQRIGMGSPYTDAFAQLNTMQGATQDTALAAIKAGVPLVQADVSQMLPADAATISANPAYTDLLSQYQAANSGAASFNPSIATADAQALAIVVSSMIAAQGAAAVPSNPSTQPATPGSGPVTPAPTPVNVTVTPSTATGVTFGAALMIALGAFLIGGAIMHFWGDEIFGHVARAKNPVRRRRRRRKS